MNSTTIAVDLAKSIFELAVSHHPGVIARHHRFTRTQFVAFFTRTAPAIFVLEACGSAHFWGRQLEQAGHRVVLLPPHTVRAYAPRNKTDRADAKALLEASRNRDIHPVPVKSVSQQTLTALHRLRSAWMGSRTARLNSLRGLLRELGVTIPVGAAHVVPRVMGLLEDADSAVPDALRGVLYQVCEEIRWLEDRVAEVERGLEQLARQTPVVAQLQTIPGIGLLTATAVVGFVGDIQRFSTGRRFASYLGLTPRESSSGLIRRLGSISKRGDVYLRMLLTHGARSVLWSTKLRQRPDRLRAWAIGIEQRRGHNKAAIALANKLARTVWAVWKHGTEYRQPAAA